jgi:hypothetical protein
MIFRKSFLLDLHEHPTPIDNCRAVHVIAIQETACKETESHIARLLKTSVKVCFTQQAITKKKCETKIAQGNRGMAAPTYIGVMVHSLVEITIFHNRLKNDCLSYTTIV